MAELADHVPMNTRLSVTATRSDPPTGETQTQPDDVIDIDTGRFRMKFGTLITIIGAIVAAVVGLVTWGVGTATKADVEGKAPIEIVAQVKENTDAVKDLGGKVDSLSEKADEEKEERKYIRARIDFLTEQAVIEGQQNPQAKQRVRRAASRVRNAARAAGDTDDPLSGIDGL